MKFRNIICLVLALVMCLSLAACGSSESAGGTPEASAGKSKKQEPAPEFVYSADFKRLLSDTTDYLTVLHCTDDGLYVSNYEKTGENNPDGEIPRYEGEFDVYSSFIYFVDLNGGMKKLDAFSCLPPKENTEGRKAFTSSGVLSGSAWTDDGFVTIESVYTSWYDGEDNVRIYSDEYWANQKYEQEYYIRWFDLKGNEKSCGKIEVGPDEWLNAYQMKVDAQGNVLVSGGSSIRAIAPDGSNSYVITTPDYIDGIISLADGSLAAIVYGDAGQQLCIVDSENGTLGECIPVSFDAYNTFPGNGEYDLFYTNGASFYGYDMEINRSDRLFSWLGCDVNGNEVTVLKVADDGTVTGLITDWNSMKQTYCFDLVNVKKVPYDSVPHKETLRMAVVYLDYDVQDMIINFNRSNDRYRIEVSDYSEYNNEQNGWDAGLTKLNTEIMSGNVPDIFCLNGLNYTQLASKGILEDLYPYIDGDPELSRSDFFENILKALEVNGRLCSTVSGFYVSSAIGASSVVGDKPGWTYEEFSEALSKMPEGCTAFDEYVTRDNILQTCLALDMNSFVDWSTGECSFDSEQFISLLNFVMSFPSEFDWDNYDYSAEESVEDRLATGKQMLVQTSAYSIDDIFYNNYTQFLGGEITYVGYPSCSGTGNMLNLAQSGYAMSSKCEHKDAVWAFLRGFFAKDYQENLYSLTSRRDVFEEKAEKACTVQYMKDSEGHFQLDDEGEKIPVAQAYMWNAETQKNEEIYCLSEQQVDQIRQLIMSTTKIADFNTEIINIVSEGAAPFFAGQRSAEDVAKQIQSKAKLYVNEQM